MKDFQIKEYEDRYHQEFKEISLEWLYKYDLYEKADDDLLDNPNKYLKNGGLFFLAHANNEIAGTVCLNPVNKNTFELLKLGVRENYKGLGIGRELIQICIYICLEKKIETVILETSSKLVDAIKLYEKIGFSQVEIKDSYYESADVKMELKI